MACLRHRRPEHGGHVHITGPEQGGGYPGGVSVGDIYPGTLLALGVVSAIHHARRTGEGQFLDMGMYDAILALNETVITNYGVAGIELGPRGQHHPNLMPLGIYPAKDGGVAIAAPGRGLWAELCQVMGRPDLIDDPRSRNVHLRRRNQDFLEPLISAWTGARTKQEIVALLGGRVPSGPVNTASEIFADPHVAARSMINRFKPPGDNPEVGIVGNASKFTVTPTGLRQPPPRLGEHTNEVLQEFGIQKSGGVQPESSKQIQN
ncbi:MAG: hypothetical protein FJ194_14515 [Gammaproteobacteria bacterium]|nr:hypothetical protein [Gammaproteobacteria bacterium]